MLHVHAGSWGSVMRGIEPGALVLADGSVFEGELIGAAVNGGMPIATGEVVFNTVLMACKWAPRTRYAKKATTEVRGGWEGARRWR